MAAWSHRAADAGLTRRIAVLLGISEPVASVLARSFSDEADAERHLRPQLAHVTDPFAVGGLREAAERLVLAAERKERIAILGDYDVDGVSSTAMLVHFLRRLGADPAYFVPRRLEEGYGLSMAALDRVLAEANPNLFVALDCGTNSKPEVDRLRAAGVEVIVVDHHVAKDQRATCTLVNPRVNDAEDAPWQSLCTAGLVFKLIHGVLKVLRLAGDERGTQILVKDYLDLAALGTIADLVPLRSENRILAAHGLRALGEARRPGVRALIAVSGMEPGGILTSVDVSYRIGPRINASGRLADASLPLKLLLSDSAADCLRDAAQLDAINRERQEIDKKVTEEATAQATAMGDLAGYVVHGDWHPGVVGIAAGKICRALDRPVIVLGKEGETARGSGRSVPGTNLVEALAVCADLLKTYGGHPMAVGVSLNVGDVEAFRARFAAAVEAQRKAGVVLADGRDIDIAHWMKSSEVTDNLLDDLDLLQPYGEGNSEPVFGLKGLVFDRAPTPFGEGNFRHQVSLGGGRRLNFVAWRMADRMPEAGRPVDLAVKLQWNRWQGRRLPQAEILDWRYAY
ncbi:MAG: single-stranded-DNA-specific exonuclease RecJ [Verrucomicrobia bacterium]|nr:single-stranded-DNA-specific exonuclease RecJ [Verrucomicrobiota bacterium]NBY36543.1 single-stranded-DNA-specific exonuclease RecJ [Verrucomicrobiota bacterium]